MHFRNRTSLCCVVISFLTLGCDTSPDIRYDQLALVEVSGTVTLDERPLPNAVVVFEADSGRFSYGLTDADGYFTLHFDSQQQGVTPGQKTVRISTTRKIVGLNTSGGETPAGEAPREGQRGRPETELVPARYNRDSRLTVTVKPGEDQVFDFDLTSGTVAARVEE